ncbi:hypothetical protein ACFV8E_30955 [Streptomyces sp. NPDC059849]|uniref:hypothetical protein n=1 Tax=Streptomyces sp. NPDC059849 TaxID=3346969 RepID=UPI003663BA3F
MGEAGIEARGDLSRVPGTQVRVACEGPVGLAVGGYCPVTEKVLRAAPSAGRVGCWAELTRYSGPYQVIADRGR